MQITGGKFKLSRTLVQVFIKYLTPGQTVVEPFCGGCNVTFRLGESKVAGPIYAYDFNPYIIAMWKAVQQGWLPPMEVSEHLYRAVKDNKDEFDPALVGFIGHATTFGGKWFGGYARRSKANEGDVCNFAAIGRNAILKQRQGILLVNFECRSYQNVRIEPGSFVYCDPPYAGTDMNAYGDKSKWNADAFWAWAEKVSEHSTVLVSEYNAPPNWERIFAKEIKMTAFHEEAQTRVDSLWKLRTPDPRTAKTVRYQTHAWSSML